MLKSFSKLFLIGSVIILISLTAFKSNNKKIKNKFTSLEKHLKFGNVTGEILSKGGHSEECVKFNIKNQKKDTIYILIEPGRRLVSHDSTFQDILILKTYEIVLPPLASTIISGYGFCCQSSKGSPEKESKFYIGFMAPKTWVELAQFIDKRNFPSNAIQHAVWVMSNNHPLSSIHNEKPEVVLELKKYVAKLKNIELPWYSLTFANDTSRLFSGRPKMLWGNINYNLKHNAILSINIKNSKDVIVATLVNRVAKGPGKYSYNVHLPVLSWPKGKYTVNIIEDYSNIILKKEFIL